MELENALDKAQSKASNHGGKRPGAGGKYRWGEKTVVMRIPESQVEAVKQFLAERLKTKNETPKPAKTKRVIKVHYIDRQGYLIPDVYVFNDFPKLNDADYHFQECLLREVPKGKVARFSIDFCNENDEILESTRINKAAFELIFNRKVKTQKEYERLKNII